jgi:penicillin amidase
MLENNDPPEEIPMSPKLKRTLFWILIILLSLVIILSLFGFITIRRSFPKVDGPITVPGLSNEVEIIRDSMGVPHLYASTEHDLFMAQGYVHAQDRFFQMDFWRHIGAGRLAEMFGESQVETDIFLRTMGWTRLAEKEIENLDAESRAILQAYTDGVNAYLAEHHGAELSFEYVLLGVLSPDYEPEPWEISNILTWAKVMAFDLSGNSSGWQDLTRAKIYKQIGAEKAQDLNPTYPSEHPFIVPEPSSPEARQEQDNESAEYHIDPSTAPPTAIDWISTGPIFGSNSWVISGERTTTGSPLLANDPHLGIQLPSIWYEVGLHCQPITEACRSNVTGFSFAGAPGVIIGHNGDIAWGFTNVGPDVLDLFIEKINPENPNQYEVNGEWRDMTLIDETIQVAGGEPITITVRKTHHGPIFSDIDDAFDDLTGTTNLGVPSNYAVSVCWTALEPSSIFKAILNMNTASDWASFRNALRDFNVPSQNMIYADVHGNIGYQTPGNIPIRTSGDGLLPVPGWTEAYDWQGYIPFDELPSSYNPSQGFIVTANNAIVGSEYPYSISRTWDLGYRANRISDLIQGHEKISIQDIQAIQGDNFHAMGPILIPILTSLSFEDQELNQYASELEGWDYQNNLESRQAAIFNAFWRHLLLETFSDEIPENIPSSSAAFLIIENLADDLQNSWWDDIETPTIEKRDEIMTRAFQAAILELEDVLGKDDRDWLWGDLHTRTFRSELGIGPLSLIFNRGPFPTDGGSSLVNNNSWNEAKDYDVVVLPSMRMIVDLANLENSYTIHTTGQSGHAFHPHYIDMADLWGMNVLHPMLWSREQVESAQESWLTLTPK